MIMGKKKETKELLESPTTPGCADVISCNPRSDTVKVRAKNAKGKRTSENIKITLQERQLVGIERGKPKPKKEKKKSDKKKPKKKSSKK